jgi:threonine synthase
VFAVLRCTECRATVPEDEPVWSCPSCGSLLEIQSDLSGLRIGRDQLEEARARPAGEGIWRYRSLIPIDEAAAVTLGEGNTPVVALRSLGRELGLSRLYAKLEYFSPTGSFKDRGTTALVSKARQLGVRHLVEDSSGNAGASIAAYCARAGIRASIYVPASAPEAKRAQIAVYGAEVVAVEGTRDAVTEAAMERCRRDGAYYGSHNWNPFFLEGTKSFAYEVALDFGFDPPAHLVMPVGNGSLFLGAWRGFEELRGLGLLQKLPRLHVAQATGCMPIVNAVRRGLERTEVVPTTPTVAGGISIGRPSRGEMIIRAVRDSGGSGEAVADEEILRHQRMLASMEGIFCEPTSAAAFAALPGLVAEGRIGPEEGVLVAVTGMGLKDVGALMAR